MPSKRRSILIAIVIFLLGVAPFELPTARAALDINTDAVKKVIVFIYPANANGEPDTDHPDATGFLVNVPTTTTPIQYYLLLITARHVVDPQWANCPTPNPKQIFLRLNKKNYDPTKDPTGVGYVPIPLVGPTGPLFTTSDDESDVAAVLIRPQELNIDTYDISALPVSVLATADEEKNLSIGDDLVSAGLLPGYTGVKRNYPIFKFGRVSDIPDETAPMLCAPNTPPRFVRAWFIAANLFPGASGSPIFYVPFGANGVSLGGGRAFLAGLQSNSIIEADVAGMTPAHAIFDAIEAMKLQNANLYRGASQPPQSPNAPQPVQK